MMTTIENKIEDESNNSDNEDLANQANNLVSSEPELVTNAQETTETTNQLDNELANAGELSRSETNSGIISSFAALARDSNALVIPSKHAFNFQQALKFSRNNDIDIQCTSPITAIKFIINHPSLASKLVGSNIMKLYYFALLESIAYNLKYHIEYYSENDSIVRFSGGKEASQILKIYQSQEGDQFIKKLDIKPQYIKESLDLFYQPNPFTYVIDFQLDFLRLMLNPSFHNLKSFLGNGYSSMPLLLIASSIYTGSYFITCAAALTYSKYAAKMLFPHFFQTKDTSLNVDWIIQEGDNGIINSIADLPLQPLSTNSIPLIQNSGGESSNAQLTAGNIDQPDPITEFKSRTEDLKLSTDKLTYLSKQFDVFVDGVRLVQEPTLDNLKAFAQNALFFGVVLTGTTNYLPFVTAVNIASIAYNGEYYKAGLYGAGYYLLNKYANSHFAPLYGAVIAGVNFSKFVSNAFDLYSNWGTIESKLKSDIAYADLYYYLDYKNYAKTLLDDANMIVSKDFEEHHNHDSVIQKLAKEKDLQGKLCNWFNKCVSVDADMIASRDAVKHHQPSPYEILEEADFLGNFNNIILNEDIAL